MTKKRTLLVLLVVTALGLGGFATPEYLSRPEPGVSEECFAALRHEMCLAQVEAILGRPADNVRAVGDSTTVRAWQDGGFIIVLSFNDADQLTDGRQLYMLFNGGHWERGNLCEPTSLLDRVKALLHL